MARPTSLSFSPDDKASFALACWDGSVAIFLSTHSNASFDNDKCAASSGGRAWKRVWRETTAPATIGGATSGNFEDQDGTFLCWCRGSTDESPATLMVSSYKVKIGACAHSSSHELPLAHNEGTGARDLLQCADHVATTAPGFEVFVDALGERVGGAVLDPLGPGAIRSTVERYLIHGLAADQGAIALYDSNLCLFVIPLSMLYGTGCIKVLSDGQNYSGPGAPGTGRGAVFEAKELAAPLPRKLTLVNNDHGLVAAKVRLHCGSEGHRIGDDPPEGLRLSVLWRDAKTGEDTPDHGGLGGVAEGGEFARLPFLPGELADRDEEQGGVFGADIRYGRLALFTRYVTLIYARPDSGSSCGESLESRAGSWETYATYPLVHGVLLGGTSKIVGFLKTFISCIRRSCFPSFMRLTQALGPSRRASSFSMNFSCQDFVHAHAGFRPFLLRFFDPLLRRCSDPILGHLCTTQSPFLLPSSVSQERPRRRLFASPIPRQTSPSSISSRSWKPRKEAEVVARLSGSSPFVIDPSRRGVGSTSPMEFVRRRWDGKALRFACTFLQDPGEERS